MMLDHWLCSGLNEDRANAWPIDPQIAQISQMRSKIMSLFLDLRNRRNLRTKLFGLCRELEKGDAAGHSVRRFCRFVRLRQLPHLPPATPAGPSENDGLRFQKFGSNQTNLRPDARCDGCDQPTTRSARRVAFPARLCEPARSGIPAWSRTRRRISAGECDMGTATDWLAPMRSTTYSGT